MNILFILLAFSLTAIEEGISTRRTQAIVRKNAVQAANWSSIFDLVLFIDVYLIIGRWWLVFPICLGSWIGSWWSVHSQKEGSCSD